MNAAPTFTTSADGQLNFTSANALSTAGNASIVNDDGGVTVFSGNSTAGTANITNNGGVIIGAVHTGSTVFTNSSTAATSTITTNSGFVGFIGTSSGDLATFITNGGGTFDISGLTSGGMTAGSVAGTGTYQLGSKVLTVGGNNGTTEVSGSIVDGGVSGGTGGSLVKVGPGTLTLSGTNTYSGGTTIEEGVISVASDSNLGNMSGGITLQGGELLTTANGFSSARAINLGVADSNDTLAAVTNTMATYTGVISGDGDLTVGDGTHTGTVVLNGEQHLHRRLHDH